MGLGRPDGVAGSAHLGRFGDAIARAPGRSSFAWALAAAALAWALPDRLWFVGDFLMRQGTVRVGEEFSRMFPQALPLDRLLHYGLPRFLTETALVNACRWTISGCSPRPRRR